MRLRRTWHSLMYLIAIIVTIGQASVSAEECNIPKVFFINGVWNYQWQAQDSSRALERAIAAYGGPNIHIETIYNPTDGKLGDAIEVAQDHELARRALDVSWLVAFGLDISSETIAIIANSNTFGAMINFLVHAPVDGVSYTDWVTGMFDGTEVSFRNERVITKIQNRLLEEIVDRKTPVVVIAHSEGNLYLNIALSRLKVFNYITASTPGVKAIGALGLAVASNLNPASFTGDKDLYSYITRDDDRIMQLLVGNLESNFIYLDQAEVFVTPFHHELIPEYLNRNILGYFKGETIDIGSAAVKEFKAVYDQVGRRFPCITSGSGEPSENADGQTMTLSARVVSRSGTPISGGRVNFTDVNNQPLCTGVAITDGQGIWSCQHAFPEGSLPQTVRAQWSEQASLEWPEDEFKSLPYDFEVTQGPNMLGDTLVIGRRYPNLQTPYLEFHPPSVSTVVAKGALDQIVWHAGPADIEYAIINPEANRIAFTFPQASIFDEGASIFDGFVLTGFSHPIRSATLVDDSTGMSIRLSHTSDEIHINISGSYGNGTGFKLLVLFDSTENEL